MEKEQKCILGVILLLVLLAVFGLTCLSALIFMVLWNLVMPIFGITALSFWKAWALHLLIGIIANAFNGSYQTKLENLKTDLRNLNAAIKANVTVLNEEDINNTEVNTEKSDKPKKPRRRKSKKNVNNDNSPT